IRCDLEGETSSMRACRPRAVFGARSGFEITYRALAPGSYTFTAKLRLLDGDGISALRHFWVGVEPSIVTSATPGGLSVVAGTPEEDVAILSGGKGKPVPSGRVSFVLCAPGAVTGSGCPTGSGTAVGPGVTLSEGHASSAATGGALTAAPGEYCWRV